jgi:hypothetical protein
MHQQEKQELLDMISTVEEEEQKKVKESIEGHEA